MRALVNGIVISIDPVLIEIGHFPVRWFYIFFAIAIFAGVWFALREIARKRLPLDHARSLASWAVIGGLIGARLFHVIDRWDLYADAPWRALFVWEGGIAVYGGLIGGVLVALVYARMHRLPIWEIGDAAAPGMLLGQALGRLGCIPNGDAYGAPADVPWAFVYTHPGSVPERFGGVPLHPYPVYELVFNLALLGALWKLRLHPAFERRPGLVFLTYAAVHSLGRFLLTSYRVERIWFWGLQEAQVLSLAGFLLALGAIAYLVVVQYGRGREPSLRAAST